MKKPCKNCGSTDWVRLTISMSKDGVVEMCDKCKTNNTKLSILLTGLPTSKTGISQDRYASAVNLANKTGRTINL